MVLGIHGLLLTSCVGAGNCSSIPLVAYDRPFELAVADELKAAPDSALARAVTDYRELRQMVRACKGG